MALTCIGIDLGGTFVKFGRFDEVMGWRGRGELATPAGGGAEGVAATMVAGARRLMDEAAAGGDEVVGVGIGSPGPLDLERGLVVAMPNVPGFDNFPLRDRVGEALSLPAVLDNDANLAALGEYLSGSGRALRTRPAAAGGFSGSDVMVLLTLGTGIGGGIVIDGELLHGAYGIGGELGHMIVEPDGEECGCGQRGCLERYASATYLARRARRLIEREGGRSSLAEVLRERGDITAKDVCAAAAEGDALAREVWDRAMRFLAVGCVTIARALDPAMIVLGGGMAAAGEALLAPLRGHFARLHWRLTAPRTELRLAELGNDAGVIGGAGAAWARWRDRRKSDSHRGTEDTEI